MKEEIRTKLFENQDLTYRKFHSSLCPGIDNIIGVRVPIIRKLVKDILKEDYEVYLNEVDNKYYEETLIEGLIIATSKMSTSKKIEYLDFFVPKIDNWAVCDITCSSFKFKKEELPTIWKYILKYQKSKNEFELRFMVVMMMDYFLLDEYIDEVLTIIDKNKVDYYYTNMAISWLISVAFVKYRDKTIKYLKNNNLSTFTYQKSLQKIIDSYRVSQKDKDMIRKMKKQ